MLIPLRMGTYKAVGLLGKVGISLSADTLPNSSQRNANRRQREQGKGAGGGDVARGSLLYPTRLLQRGRWARGSQQCCPQAHRDGWGFEVTFQPLAVVPRGTRSRAWVTWQAVSPTAGTRRPWQWQQGHVRLLAVMATMVVAGERGRGKLADSWVLFSLALLPLSLNKRAGLHLEAPRGAPVAA